jgi:hypothetical protein
MHFSVRSIKIHNLKITGPNFNLLIKTKSNGKTYIKCNIFKPNAMFPTFDIQFLPDLIAKQ